MDAGLELYCGIAQQGSCKGRETAGIEKDTQTDGAACRLQFAQREQ